MCALATYKFRNPRMDARLMRTVSDNFGIPVMFIRLNPNSYRIPEISSSILHLGDLGVLVQITYLLV